jgi:hypothetical protein
MSETEQHIWTLKCDRKSCTSKLQLKTKDRKSQSAELKKRARAKGWRFRFFESVCPKCVKAGQ